MRLAPAAMRERRPRAGSEVRWMFSWALLLVILFVASYEKTSRCRRETVFPLHLLSNRDLSPLLDGEDECGRGEIRGMWAAVQQAVEVEDRDRGERPERHGYLARGPGQALAQVVAEEVPHGEAGADAGPGGKDGEAGPLEEADVAGEAEVLVVVGVAVKTLEERGRREHLSARAQRAVHLPDRGFRVLQMLEHRFAVD